MGTASGGHLKCPYRRGGDPLRQLGGKPIWRRGEGSNASGPLDQFGQACRMGRFWRAIVCLGLVAVTATSCSGGNSANTTSTSTRNTSVPPAASTTSIASTTTTTESLTVSVVASPNPVATGLPVTFTVVIRGPGVLSVEDVRFGDGGSTGANAGMIKCGQTARADLTSDFTHSYAAPGTYQFRDQVGVIGPPPACRSEDVTGTATAIVSSPLQSATLNGAFLSPTRNIACLIDITANELVRCATFSPPRLVTMTATGSLNTCSGSQCELGNPSLDTPTLAYGTATGAGPFQCVSATRGVTCTIAGGKGFTISRSGIEQIGG